jgi:hypothetical protein
MVLTDTNVSWVNFRGTWTTNVLLIVALKATLSILPGVSRELSWSLTNLVYGVVTFFFFHWKLGTAFDVTQGESHELTFWEQLEQDDTQDTQSTKKFLTATPLILFLLSCHYTRYDFATFCVNFAITLIAIVAKFPSMYRVRLFGINDRKGVSSSSSASGNGQNLLRNMSRRNASSSSTTSSTTKRH